jgi:hypothetical protein
MLCIRSHKKTFCSDSYVVNVKNICWSVVCNDKQLDAALDTFVKLLILVTNKHAPHYENDCENC